MNKLDVSSILKEGTKISTRIGSNIKWHENIVYKTECNTVCTSLIANYLDNVVLPGTNVSLKYTDDYFEYLLHGTVTYVRSNEPSFINININKLDKFINTRAFRRYDIFLASNITFENDKVSYFSIITNISLGGITFLLNHPFEVGEEATVSISLPNNSIITAKGEIARRTMEKNISSYGLKFTKLDDYNKNLLTEYINSLEQKWEMKQINFESFPTNKSNP